MIPIKFPKEWFLDETRQDRVNLLFSECFERREISIKVYTPYQLTSCLAKGNTVDCNRQMTSLHVSGMVFRKQQAVHCNNGGPRYRYSHLGHFHGRSLRPEIAVLHPFMMRYQTANHRASPLPKYRTQSVQPRTSSTSIKERLNLYTRHMTQDAAFRPKQGNALIARAQGNTATDQGTSVPEILQSKGRTLRVTYIRRDGDYEV